MTETKAAPSAKGLFRATGNKAKRQPKQMLDGSFEMTDEGLEREPNEFYPTPVEPTRALLAAELGRLRTIEGIWEPAAGDGAMRREMHALGLVTYGSDLIERGGSDTIRSFYDFKIPAFPAIVTNSPVAECNWRDGKGRWLVHALETLNVEYMALLLNWTWPGAFGLAGIWRDHPPARVYLCRWKIDFTGQGAPPMLNAWFVWDREHRGEPVLRMLDRADARQTEMFP